MSFGFCRCRGNYELDNPVRQIFIFLCLREVDGSIVQPHFFTRSRLAFLRRSQKQGGERQHADTAGATTTSDHSERRVDAEPAGLRHLTGNESESSVGDIEAGRRPIATAGKFRHHHPRAIGQIEYSPVGETNPNSATRRGLDDVAGADWIAGPDLDRRVISSRECARADYGLDSTNIKRRRFRWL